MDTTNTHRNTFRSAATKFAITAARVAVWMLECSQTAEMIIPTGLKMATTSVVFTLASAHRQNTHHKLELARICRASYWIFTITWITDLLRAIAAPGCRYLRAAIRALNRNLNRSLDDIDVDVVINDDINDDTNEDTNDDTV